MDEFVFDLPTSPNQYSVVLAPASLRKIDFSGLDYDTARKAIFEYIQAYFPDQFNDFVASNGIVMMTEIVSSVVGKLSLRSDLLANESTLPTARTERAVSNHLALINQRIRNATAAVTDVEISIVNPTFTDLSIPGGIKISLTGPNGTTLNYEVFKSPYDYTSNIVIPAGKRGVIAYGIEGTTVVGDKAISTGGKNQKYIINDKNILDSPIVIAVTYGDTTVNYTPIFDPIQRYGPSDTVAEVNITSNDMTVRFGDDITGKSPRIGSEIVVTYRKGGGVRGRIGAFVIDTTRQFKAAAPANAPVSVRFRNITASSGGTDRESLDDAKKRAPRDYALQRSVVTANDYAQAATSFTHPAFGSVAKAVATTKTSQNANIVDLWILVYGPTGLDYPSIGLKTALENHINKINVCTDTTIVNSGRKKSVTFKSNIILHRNAEASTVKSKVEAAISTYFDYTNWQMGQPFYLSNLIETLQAIDGVLYVDVFSPTNNILPDQMIASDETPSAFNRIGINEIITLGDKVTNYYYEKT